MRFSLLQERSALFNYPHSAPIAQLVEQLICNQWVGSSSLSGGTINFNKNYIKQCINFYWWFLHTFLSTLLLTMPC